MIRILNASEASPLISKKHDRLKEAREVVQPILDDVEAHGDEAVRKYAWRFDGFDRTSFVVAESERRGAYESASDALRSALEVSSRNIRAFAELQMPSEFMTELSPGHFVGQIVRPIDSIAAYIPGGRYPLPSTVLMTCIPALVAGVANVWATTPKPNRDVLAAAHTAGVCNVALIGGAHAIAAFAFGTETIPKVGRIVGPGNVFVSAAKQILSGQVGIDFVAGPTEIVIVSDEGNPRWIAADMLAQAEHDTDACAFLLTTSRSLAEAVAEQIDAQLRSLTTSEVARISIEGNSGIILCESGDHALELANRIGAEHLCVPERAAASKVRTAGSIFVGPFSPEAAGDYISGPNHVLPTAGQAALSGGLSVLDFVKVITIQELSQAALRDIGASGALLARTEGLEGHARSIEMRLES